VGGRWKFIGGVEPGELYDLQSDPAEEHDVFASHAPVATAMARRVREITATAARAASAPLSADAVERLRALGYVASAPQPSSSRTGAPSPRLLISAWPRFQSAVSEMAAGRHEGAVPALATLVHEFPDSPVFVATYGRALDGAGHAAEALRIYRGAVSRWPSNTSLLQGLATAARTAGFADEALKAERAILAIDPTDAAAENGVGLVLADRAQPGDARDAFRRAVTLDPHVVSYWVNLGNACRAAGQPREAEDAYRRALSLDAASVDAMNGIGVLLVQSDQFAEAATWFERAVARTPEFYEAWLNLGIARQEEGKLGAAAAAYRRVLTAPRQYRQQRESARQLLASLAAR
jgi:Tfp pilus assembly protein PilF